MKPWPRLSETGDGARDGEHCFACGVARVLAELEAWEEHDESDRREGIAVLLCGACSAALIGPHPRLYRPIEALEPFPGLMALCGGCGWRDGVRCSHASLRRNGGAGLEVTYPPPTTGIACGRGSRGGRTSMRFVLWQGPPTACAGREARA